MIVRLISLFPVLLLAPASAETLTTPRLTCEVANSAVSTTLTARTKGCAEPVVFRIDWKDGAEGFKTTPAKDGAITSTQRLGKTTLTRTILSSAAADCILIHVIADQPGAVSLTARFISDQPMEIRNRREILLSAKEIHAHAWVIPFESDVHESGKTITLAGEGEALIILNLTADPESSPVSNTLTRLGEKYDTAHSPPSPRLIWEGIEEEREKD